jgi:imidazole glycerol-phosphate synthase subunit HisH
MKVAVVKYNAGNVRSVANAVRRLGVEPVLTDHPDEMKAADKVIFPGVGEASSAMAHLRERDLDAAIRSLTQPVLAICLGMQLLYRASEENDTECLDILPDKVRRFSDGALKIPHMGWNNISGFSSPVFDGVAEDSRVYFVHSYFIETGDHTAATAFYGTGFSAAIRYRNFYGVQFHPEKSGAVGARILENFLNI